jgi:superfamily II DNA helicase RecQ
MNVTKRKMNVGTIMLAIHKAMKHFNPKCKAKPNQNLECWEHFLAGKHVIVTLPVGYGKSLIRLNTGCRKL